MWCGFYKEELTQNKDAKSLKMQYNRSRIDEIGSQLEKGIHLTS